MNFFERLSGGELGPILTLASVWFFIFTIKYHLELIRIAKWPSTTGDLIKLEYRDGDGSIPAILGLKYEFCIDGIQYVGRRLAHITFGTGRGTASIIRGMIDRVDRTDGQKVVIYYNSKNPKKSMLLKPSKLEYSLLLVCYFGALLLAFLGLTI